MKKILLCTNWKMNMSIIESVNYSRKLKDFVQETLPENSNIEIFIFPDFLSLYPVSQVLNKSKIKLGAQDCFWEDSGAFTGEISPMALRELGCDYIMAGHPERVNYFKEDLEIVNKKIKAILFNNLTPVVFVVEKEKKNTLAQTCKMLKNQLFPQFSGVDKKDINSTLIIYEPAWAIGTGNAAPVEHTHAILSELRDAMNAEYGFGVGTKQLFMYGGGVTLESAKDIIALDNIDGIGMGKAGLNFEFFTGAIKVTIEMEKAKKLNIKD